MRKKKEIKLHPALLFFVLTIIFLILAIITIQSTYARYVTALTATSSIELGTWSFSINNQNIMENSDISSTVVPIFNEDSEYIAEKNTRDYAAKLMTFQKDFAKAVSEKDETKLEELNTTLKQMT